MSGAKYLITLEPDEETIAQLLTRDALGYFSSMLTGRDLAHLEFIPMIPRRGLFSIVPDQDLIQYYLDYASAYIEELGQNGWDPARAARSADSFVTKLEGISGQVRGASELRAVQFA